MLKIEICTLGGAPEPIIKSLSNHRPDMVCFLASQQSVVAIGEVTTALKAQNITFECHTVLINDAQDLEECYEKALLCCQWAQQQRSEEPRELIIEITGGTKLMVAALSMAAVRHSVIFSYVGGKERTKDGLGIVITGTESVNHFSNPWEKHAVEIKSKIQDFFNKHHFYACRLILEDVLHTLAGDEKVRFQILHRLILGYEAWDSFDHRSALKEIKKAEAELQQLQAFNAAGFLDKIVPSVTAHGQFLVTLSQGDPALPSQARCDDLYANAQRRLMAGKYDDATARLYRLTEMLGQLQMKACCQHSTSRFPLANVPETLREEYRLKYGDGETVKIPLEATYRLLDALDNPLGQLFMSRKSEFAQLQQARNLSVLAHGNIPVGQEVAQKLLQFVNQIYQPQVNISFPEIKIP